VIGEGPAQRERGGRDATAAATAATAATAPFRFSRMGPKGVNRQLGESNRRRIANEMAAGGGDFSQIPAGFTYLGRFVDHELSFDRTSVTLPGERVAGRHAAGALAERATRCSKDTPLRDDRSSRS
jgi:hypothetical protein